ncbi:MAG: hypothetical protein WC707_01540 [Candidatus Babeliaceae bacterium]|jgi:hypothetical protein
MAIIINKNGYEHALSIINKGLEVDHSATNWEEVRPSRDEEVRFLNTHSLDEYGLWFLGLKTDADQKDISKFVYPFGDFNIVHKSALIAAEKNATQFGHEEIKAVAQKLLNTINQHKK